ncbi:MAG: Ig-like domain-containing protein [Nitrosomonas sp.]|nr:Ig-like domain-containing protein [Nitrosomonas sp.]
MMKRLKVGSTGNIVINNGSDTRTIAIDDDSQITFDGYSGVIINPTTDLILGANYSVMIDNGAITDLAGNPYAGINDDTTLNFTTISSNPLLTGSNPPDNSANLQVDGNIELYFNEAVKPGNTGNIVISNGSDTRTIAISDTSQVSFDGYSGVIINSTADLIPGTNYSVKIDSGAITDLAGNTYAGISNDTSLNFTTISTDPRLSGSNPWDDTEFQIDHNIELYFNEMVKAGNTGNIVISNGSDTRTIAIDDASQVTFDGYSDVIINPAADLIPNTNYSIKIDSGAITDLAGNTYAGINDDTSLNFTTISTDPRLSGSNPWDDSEFQIDHNIELYFNEMVKAGSTGNIVISNGSDTRTIAINDDSQVTFDVYNRIVINPTADLIPGTDYSVKIGSGAITDLAGNAYAGISDDTTLNFTTIPTNQS